MLQKKLTSSTIRKNKGGKSMEAIEKILKKTGWSSLITSVIFAIIGSILIAKPEGTVKIASYIIGIIFIFAGIYKIFNCPVLFRINRITTVGCDYDRHIII